VTEANTEQILGNKLIDSTVIDNHFFALQHSFKIASIEYAVPLQSAGKIWQSAH